MCFSSEEMHKKATAQWSQLTPDLVQEIANRLPEFPDRIRLRGVCTQCRSISIPKSLPLQLPWLLLTPGTDRPREFDGKVRFFSLSEKRVYVFHLPELQDHFIFTSPNENGSGNGLLIAISTKTVKVGGEIEFSLKLVNPITKSLIRLPSLSIPQACSIEKVKVFGREEVEPVVVLRTDCCSNVYFTSPSKTSWSKINVLSIEPSDFFIRSKRLFVFYGIRGLTRIFDMNTSQLLAKLDAVSVSSDSQNLVESPSGELLLVHRSMINKIYRRDDVVFEYEFFRLSGSEKQPNWECINSIGSGTTLFVAVHHMLCFSSSDYKGCRGNCAYLLCGDLSLGHPCRGIAINQFVGSNGVWRFDLGERRYEQLQLNFMDGDSNRWYPATWFVPSLQ